MSLAVIFTGCGGDDVIKGINGSDGRDGTDGKDGTVWHTGEGAPDGKSVSASLGDFYLDTESADVYKLSDDGWSYLLNIKGESVNDNGSGNDDAEDSAVGSLFYTGEGAPNNAFGKNGDVYFDTLAKDVWHKNEDIWSIIGNMSGEVLKQEWEEDNILKILFIGNSFSVDTARYMYDVAKNLGVENVKIGNLYIGGCSIDKHLGNVKENLPAYTYYVNDSGEWQTFTDYTAKDALLSENWDYISYQQVSHSSGVASSYERLDELVSLTEPLCPKAKLLFNMTWAYDRESTHSGFLNYDSNQKTMYYAIADTVESVIVGSGKFDLISYTGTAIQNARASLIGDNLTRDGFHLSNYGRYVAGLAFLHTAVGLDIDTLSYIPEDFDKNVYNPNGADTVSLSDLGITLTKDAAIEIAKAAVKDAAKTPFESSFSEEERKYIEILWQNGCYRSDNNEYYYSLISNISTSSQYFATQKFTKETLPMGAVIVIAEGYTLSIDGWFNAGKNDNRPDEISGGATVTVDESFWDSPGVTSGGVEIGFNEVAFSIRRDDFSDISALTESELNEIFKIYIPQI